MTEKLKKMMDDHAEAADFAPLDLESLTTEGDRRVRRRRWTGAAAGVAAAAAVAAVVVVPMTLDGQASRGDDTSTVDPAAPGDERSVSWATDTVIHDGDRAIDTGHQVDAYVQTAEGFVLASGGRVYSVVGSQVEPVGRLVEGQEPRLVSDREGTRAGWQGPDGFYVVDQSSGVVQSIKGVAGPRSRFYALDGTTAYWLTGSDVVEAFDLDTKRGVLVQKDPPSGHELMDVQAGVQAVSTDDGTWVGTDRQHGVQLTGAYADHGELSPDAAWFAIDADEAEVYDTSSGDRVDFQLSDYTFASAVTWLDERHVVVIASPNMKGPANLLTCAVPAGTCTTTVPDLGDFDDLVGHFQLPVGMGITG